MACSEAEEVSEIEVSKVEVACSEAEEVSELEADSEVDSVASSALLVSSLLVLHYYPHLQFLKLV